MLGTMEVVDLGVEKLMLPLEVSLISVPSSTTPGLNHDICWNFLLYSHFAHTSSTDLTWLHDEIMS